MKVLIGNHVYDSLLDPIAIIFEDFEKEKLKNMGEDVYVFLSSRQAENQEENDLILDGVKRSLIAYYTRKNHRPVGEKQ
jgi:hypothetical protein